MSVSRLDLSAEDAPISEEISNAISRVVKSGRFIGGPEVEHFEEELVDAVGLSEAVTCASGTDAITLGLMAIRDGYSRQGCDRVVVPAFSFSATASAVIRAGLKPDFVDVDPDTLLIDWDQAQDKARGALAVLPVHLYGRLCSVPDIRVPVLEDACQAFGLRAVGMSGYAAFSFFPSKPLGCYGDGGAFLCADVRVANLARSFGRHGASVGGPYFSDVAGFNSRLDTIQAAILRVKLKTVRERIQAREKIAHTYMECLGSLDWLKLPSLVSQSTWHCYVVRVELKPGDFRRERLRLHLLGRGIDAVVQYPTPLHKQRAFHTDVSLPHAEKASHTVLGLPIWAGMGESRVLEVVDAVRSFGA